MEGKKQHKYLPVLVIILIMLFVASGVGLGVWYYMDQQSQKDKKAAEITAQNLQKQISELKKSISSKNTSSDSSTNIFDFNTIKVGDRVAGMTVTKINRPDDYVERGGGNIQFSGPAIIRGEYEITTDGDEAAIIGENICVMSLDEASQKLIPKEKTDTRNAWFCLTNKEEAKKILGPEKRGTAEMIIDDYYVTFAQTSAWNTARYLPFE